MRVQERISSDELTASASSITLESAASRAGTRPSVARAARSVSAGGAPPDRAERLGLLLGLQAQGDGAQQDPVPVARRLSARGDGVARGLELPGLEAQVLEPGEVRAQRPGAVVVVLDGAEHPVERTASRTRRRRRRTRPPRRGSSASSMSSAARPASSKRPSTWPMASFSSTTCSALRFDSARLPLETLRATRGTCGTRRPSAPRGRRAPAPSRGRRSGRWPPRAAAPPLVEPVEDRPRAEVARGHRGEDLRVGEAAGDPALERRARCCRSLAVTRSSNSCARAISAARSSKARAIVGAVVGFDPGPDGGGRRGLEELCGRPGAGRADGRVAALPGRQDGRQEVDLVDDVLVDVGLREVEPQKVKGDLLVLGLHLLEEAAHVGGRDVAVGVAELAAEGVEAVRELADARRDLLGRRRVDRAGDRRARRRRASRSRARSPARSRRRSSGRHAETGGTSTAP